MNTSFMIKWPEKMGPWAGSNTLFPEKIWSGIRDMEVCQELDNFIHSHHSSGRNILKLRPKVTTIRENKSFRYKQGIKIHPYCWEGKPYRSKHLYFAPLLEIKRVQNIDINVKCRTIWVDDKVLDNVEANYLAHNDGFENLDKFFLWFNQDWTGSIIHWTNLKY